MSDLRYTMVQSAELNELRRLAAEYEASKRFIELGKAVDKAFEEGLELRDRTPRDEYRRTGEMYKIIAHNNDELLEWAEREGE